MKNNIVKTTLLILVIVSSVVIINYWSEISNWILKVLTIENTIKNHQTAKKIIFSLNTVLVLFCAFVFNKSASLAVKIVLVLLTIIWISIFFFNVFFTATVM